MWSLEIFKNFEWAFNSKTITFLNWNMIWVWIISINFSEIMEVCKLIQKDFHYPWAYCIDFSYFFACVLKISDIWRLLKKLDVCCNLFLRGWKPRSYCRAWQRTNTPAAQQQRKFTITDGLKIPGQGRSILL